MIQYAIIIVIDLVFNFLYATEIATLVLLIQGR